MLLLLPAAALAWTSASTTATVGGCTITGLDGAAMHTHGGSSAQLGSARFRVACDHPASLTVTKIEYVTGHSCDALPATVSSAPAFGGLITDGMSESARTVQVTAPVEVTVGFPAVEAYYTYCDRFAFRVTFRVGDQPLVATAETNVTREEPLREVP